jgi:hypothetical protein
LTWKLKIENYIKCAGCDQRKCKQMFAI